MSVEELANKVSMLEGMLDSFICDRLTNWNGSDGSGGMTGHDSICMPIFGGDAETAGCYSISSIDKDGKIDFDNPYYNVGGKTYSGPDSVTVPPAGGIVALKLWAADQHGCQLEVFADLSELQNEQKDYDYYIVPLYYLDEGLAIKCDFRKSVVAIMGEF